MNELRRNKGPWKHRFIIGLFTVALAALAYWLLGFILDDIGSVRGPYYPDVEKRFLDQALVGQLADVDKQIADRRRNMQDQRERQNILRDSTDSSQRTMNQMLEFQRLNLEKGVKPLTEQQTALAESQNIFLANQKRYQTLNEEIARLNEELRSLEEKKRTIEASLEQQRGPAREEFQKLSHKHAIKVASLKLLVLIPLLLIALYLFLKKRGSLYAPIIYAAGVALACRVLAVIHEHFPARSFKYILLVLLTAIVLRILVYLLRMVAFPKRDWLLAQYKEAYARFSCPVCDYPIRRGPLKYAFWTRRTVKKLAAVSEPASAAAPEETYTCPSCGTKVYEPCEACRAVRASLLPFCDKCGAEKPAAAS